MKNLKTSDAANPKREIHMTAFVEDSWVYGWTHYGMTGQTKARMNELTREVEIFDCKNWIKCVAGSDDFFTANSDSKLEDHLQRH
jgi:hypothetical protein